MTFVTENNIENISEYILFVVERRTNESSFFSLKKKTKIDSDDNHTKSNLNVEIYIFIHSHIGQYCVLYFLIILSYKTPFINAYHNMFNYQHGSHSCLLLFSILITICL